MPKWRQDYTHHPLAPPRGGLRSGRRNVDDLSRVQIMSIAVIVSLLVVAVAVAITYW